MHIGFIAIFLAIDGRLRMPIERMEFFSRNNTNSSRNNANVSRNIANFSRYFTKNQALTLLFKEFAL